MSNRASVPSINFGFVSSGANSVLINTQDNWTTAVTSDTVDDGKLNNLNDVFRNSPAPVKINAGLYFRYVKKKFTSIQKRELENRLKKLVHLQLQAEMTDQKGLLEEVESMLLVAAREQVLVVKKLDRFVQKDVIDKFIAKTENVYINQLEKFPRPIPTNVQKKIKAARELKVFDDFVVVYTDYTKEPVKKSNADKIREKDPIVFGKMTGAPDRLYYIADWIDEFCDLTLDKLVERCKPEDGSELVRRVDDLKSGLLVEELTKRVQGRIDRLNQTTRENWRQFERQASTEKKMTSPSRPWWKKLLFIQ